MGGGSYVHCPEKAESGEGMDGGTGRGGEDRERGVIILP